MLFGIKNTYQTNSYQNPICSAYVYSILQNVVKLVSAPYAGVQDSLKG